MVEVSRYDFIVHNEIKLFSTAVQSYKGHSNCGGLWRWRGLNSGGTIPLRAEIQVYINSIEGIGSDIGMYI